MTPDASGIIEPMKGSITSAASLVAGGLFAVAAALARMALHDQRVSEPADCPLVVIFTLVAVFLGVAAPFIFRSSSHEAE